MEIKLKNIVTPEEVTLGTSGYPDYVISCMIDGSKRKSKVESGLNGWYFGNIIFGGLLGILIVDPISGAIISYDDVNVTKNSTL
ncbi:MAG: hypothetical protein U9P72_02065 [Campylobacterota bacterium]|nr:hypothetical protein [Campylobacterota bacterium]